MIIPKAPKSPFAAWEYLVNLAHKKILYSIGDIIDAPRSLIQSRVEPLRNLNSKYGTFFVTGNHEYYYGKKLDILFDSII